MSVIKDDTWDSGPCSICVFHLAAVQCKNQQDFYCLCCFETWWRTLLSPGQVLSLVLTQSSGHLCIVTCLPCTHEVSASFSLGPVAGFVVLQKVNQLDTKVHCNSPRKMCTSIISPCKKCMHLQHSCWNSRRFSATGRYSSWMSNFCSALEENTVCAPFCSKSDALDGMETTHAFPWWVTELP